MNFQVFVTFLFFLLFIPNIDVTSFAENNQSSLEDSSISKEILETSSSEKIDYIISRWQTSENPNEFAKNYNLSFVDGKIAVYIFLKDIELVSNIPPEVDVKYTDGNKVIAFVNSEQIYQLEKLDFVEKIMPPELAIHPTLPKVEIPEIETQEVNEPDFLLWIIIGGIVIITIIVIFRKIKIYKLGSS